MVTSNFSFNNLSATPAATTATSTADANVGLGGSQPKSILKPAGTDGADKTAADKANETSAEALKTAAKQNILATHVPKEIAEDVKKLEAHVEKSLDHSKNIKKCGDSTSNLEKVSKMIADSQSKVVL